MNAQAASRHGFVLPVTEPWMSSKDSLTTSLWAAVPWTTWSTPATGLSSRGPGMERDYRYTVPCWAPKKEAIDQPWYWSEHRASLTEGKRWCPCVSNRSVPKRTDNDMPMPMAVRHTVAVCLGSIPKHLRPVRGMAPAGVRRVVVVVWATGDMETARPFWQSGRPPHET